MTASDVETLLVTRGGLTADQVLQVRLRDRNAFVTIPGDRVDEVVRALDGTTFADRAILVERARAR